MYLCRARIWCPFPLWAGYPELSCQAVALLFGCGSAALAVHGNLEGDGIAFKCIMIACPLFLSNLWDMTDCDTDSYREPLLQRWLGAGPGASFSTMSARPARLLDSSILLVPHL